MPDQYDVVVIGGGTNSLTAAAYMAKAGRSVLVLEKNAHFGGGAVSMEVAPGFIHDLHATGFMTCMGNPALANDELHLTSRHGLSFVEWGAAFSTLFDDGTGLITYRDIDRSCQSIAQYSARDADAYRELAGRCVQLAPLLTKGAATPPLPLHRFMGLLEESAMGRELSASFFNSAYDILCHYFESVEVKMHFMKWVAEAMENPEANGTGVLIYNLLALVHCSGAFAPVGGAQRVTDALVECIQYYGGTTLTESEVLSVIVSSGRATGVCLKDGREIRAREAVIGCIHPWNLAKFVPEIDGQLAGQARRTKLSNHGAVNQQISLSAEPIFKAHSPDVFRDCMVVEYMPRHGMESMREALDGFRFGRIPYEHVSPLTIINSFIDRSRVPEAGQCALYLYNFAPLELTDGGLEGWETKRQEYGDLVWNTFKRFTTNVDDSMILGRHIETPLDHHRHSASMMHGDIFGIGTTAGQMLGRRPIPALANYRVPGIGGLYLAGPFMHPGGTVTLGGRATAMVIYQDLGIDLAKGFEGI